MARDPVLDALDDLERSLEGNITTSRAAIERIGELRDLRLTGVSYRDLADKLGRPMVVETISANIERLRSSGAALRRAHARALHDEGLTMEQIAELFGVTRQRISAILRVPRT